jgi:hypothetical protein
MGPRVVVIGPAYLDRVLLIDRPLVEPALGPPLDQSVGGTCGFGENLRLEFVDLTGSILEVEPPPDWPGPTGRILLDRILWNGSTLRRTVQALGWHDDLGGMGAGYAAALGGTLWSALGADGDPTSEAIARLAGRAGLDHRPIRVDGRSADWTLLLTTGEYGDKLAVGFRGCHASLESEAVDPCATFPCDLLVAASIPNRIAARALSAPGARCRVFAPSLSNMIDREPGISEFAGSIDILCCNRQEWESLENREDVAWKVSILVVTEGPSGAWARYTRPDGDAGFLQVAAFPRASPPRDTNHAGEAFAATLVRTLFEENWNPASGVVSDARLDQAMTRASAAAALELDHVRFGFPRPEEIDAAMRAGIVS